MDRSQVISLLKKHEVELKRLGARRVSVFGSTARSQATEASDVDVAVALAPSLRGLARLERLDALKLRLEEVLGRPVDVVEEQARSERIRRAIERDGVRAF